MKNAVSKSKLKAHALEYFRQVEESGQELIVTDRGKPVLKIVPYHFDAAEHLSVLKESVVRYDKPFEPVGADDWESLT